MTTCWYPKHWALLSPRTVGHHVAAVISKLNTSTRVEAVAVARERGLLPAAFKHTGDGVFASFPLVTKAVDCSIAIQRRLREHRAEMPDSGLHDRIGVSAGEPFTERDDLFGAAVNLAARICGQGTAGQIVVSRAVRICR